MSESPSPTRAQYVSKMFGAIAEHYDLMNWVMTLGQDQRWRRQAAEVTELRNGDTALDVATGTGDLAMELVPRVGRSGHVIGVDFSEPMLARARTKARIRRVPISYEHADAAHLPYADSSFDAVTCGFGVRNFEDRQAGLNEMTRVVRPGRRVVILELSPPRNPVARAYMDEVIPRMGHMLARAREAYTYLPDSVRGFPDPDTLGRELQGSGLRGVAYRLLNFGTVAIHWGTKPETK